MRLKLNHKGRIVGSLLDSNVDPKYLETRDLDNILSLLQELQPSPHYSIQLPCYHVLQMPSLYLALQVNLPGCQIYMNRQVDPTAEGR